MSLTTATVGRVRDDHEAAADVAAALLGVSKQFGANHALADVDLTVERGTIHALVGENGAGKSTALGIIAGRLEPTAGEVRLFGQPLSHASPRAARNAGLAAIYQELTIVPELDAAANVYIGHPLSRRGLLSTRRMREGYAALCEQVGVAPQPSGTPAGLLSVADQQVIEILRALVFDARLILFDEPTASLGILERKALLKLMRQLRSTGKTMVFVSHNLDEVLEIADAVTVFRNGRHVATAERSAWDKRRVVKSMIGDSKELRFTDALNAELMDAQPVRRSQRPSSDQPALEVEGLSIPGAVSDITFTVNRGEILGLGGLVGSGRTSILRALAGIAPRTTGQMRVGGQAVQWPRSVRRARGYGIALLPEDRKAQGLALQMSGAANVLMADPGSVTRLGVVSEKRARRLACQAAEPFGFDVARIGEPAGNLSGGNQQKLLLARWGHCRPDVLLVDEPTRGIDIAAKDEVLRALERMAAEGMAIVFVSSELEEVALMSDRVIVLAEGRQVTTLDAQPAGIRVADILDRAFSVEEAS